MQISARTLHFSKYLIISCSGRRINFPARLFLVAVYGRHETLVMSTWPKTQAKHSLHPCEYDIIFLHREAYFPGFMLLDTCLMEP